jgi:hypothetical protein
VISADADAGVCRVPACRRAAVAYLEVNGRGGREVFVGHARSANQFPLCVEHMDHAQLSLSGSVRLRVTNE